MHLLFADVIGVCKSVDEVTRLTTKTNREVSKRTLALMDMSGKVVNVTLWGEEVSCFFLFYFVLARVYSLSVSVSPTK